LFCVVMYRRLTTVYATVNSSNHENQCTTHITVEFVEVQRQNGSDDCGVYAIAFAVAFSLSKDRGTLTLFCRVRY